ncbi:MAG: hypothetical protein GXO76_14465 [Calditrichaeota bacterium]|nr:hypothetical protein [Calditrichota bacterium]
MKKPLIIFSALENVLVNPRSFQWEDARDILNRAYLRGIPWVVWSRWPVQQVIYFRGQLGLTDPFIVESGGALYIPFGYFDVEIKAVEKEGCEVIENGLPVAPIREFMEEFRRVNHLPIRFAEEFSVEEFAQIAGIPLHLAGFYQNARYSLAFYVDPYAGGEWRDKLNVQASKRGIRIRKEGSFYMAVGRNNESVLVAKLKKWFEMSWGTNPEVMAIGAAPPDTPYLRHADRTIVFKNKGMPAASEPAEKGTVTVMSSANPERWEGIAKLFETNSEEERDDQ